MTIDFSDEEHSLEREFLFATFWHKSRRVSVSDLRMHWALSHMHYKLSRDALPPGVIEPEQQEGP